jgi:CheY-like chemotaxis protein
LQGIDVLDRLKSNAKTRHIPVHVMSVEDRENEVIQLGASSYLKKPISFDQLNTTISKIGRLSKRDTRNVLLIEDDSAQCDAIAQLLATNGIKTQVAHNVEQALRDMRKHHYDCIILDLELGEQNGMQILDTLHSDPMSDTPVVVYTGKTLSKQELKVLDQKSDSIIIKGSDSPSRLLDEVTLFLHSVEAKQPPQNIPDESDTILKEDIFLRKKILLVDDDMRNIYSMRQILMSRGLTVSQAHTGKEAVSIISDQADFDIVLMDIMMPEMSGIDTIKKIRQDRRFEKLPIIALTARAMKQDREECLQAGASDYLSKPIDVHTLLSLLRIWLARNPA